MNRGATLPEFAREVAAAPHQPWDPPLRRDASGASDPRCRAKGKPAR